MKQGKRLLSMLLAVCMLVSVLSVGAFAEDVSADVPEQESVEAPAAVAEEAAPEAEEVFEEAADTAELVDAELPTITKTQSVALDTSKTYKVFHLDCGRKYFTVDQIKAIIDTMGANDYNYLELAVGNDGLRFLLDDMSLTVNGTAYTSANVTAGIKAGNKAYCDCGTNELTQSEMDEIIAYAAAKGISIIPLLNTPGHMDAILTAMNRLGIAYPNYSNSVRTVDITNDSAVDFTLALVNKYIQYFAGKGCEIFNMGADEYANDIQSQPQFAGLISSKQYGSFVKYVNNMAAQIQNAGMVPMAFNDGIYYNQNTSYGTFDQNIVVSYWSSGWSGYNVAPASFLYNKGHQILNTNGNWYYVLKAANGTSWDTAKSNLQSTPYDSVQGSTVPVVGAMVCYWCDEPSYSYSSTEQQHVQDMITTFAAANPSVFDLNKETTEPETPVDPDPENPGDNGGQTYTKTIDLFVGDSKTETISGNNFAGTYNPSPAGIATVTVTGTDEIPERTTYNSVNTNYSTLAGSNTSWTKTEYFHKVGDNYYPVYAYRKWVGNRYYYYVGYSTNGEKPASANLADGKTNGYSTLPLYKESQTQRVPASTTITFEGVSAGTTYVTIGGTDYTINVSKKTQDVAVTVGASESYPDTAAASAQSADAAIATVRANGDQLTITGVAEGTTTVETDTCIYNVTVTAEDLSNQNTTIEFWITNREVTANSATSMSLNAATSTVNTENGAAIAELVPATGTIGNDTMVYWKTTRLASNNKQTTVGGVDKTLAGTDFTRIRYYNGTWAYFDGTNWTNVATGDQLVAYYLQKTEVTDEVETQVVDWGPVKANWSDLNYLGTKYVLLDYSVKYESGEEVPTSFTNAKTLAFHCDVSTKKNGVYYRTIGMTRAVESSDYEVYMITATPTSDNTSTVLANTAAANGTISYKGTEKVVWAETQADLDNSGLGTWTSISGNYTYSIGGDPVVPGMEIYRQQGMKITYYVRAKVTEDALTVNYVNQTTGENFYNYNIAVKSGTIFNTGIALANPWKANLKNGSVTNMLGQTQTVSADLSTMPAIGVSYRYSVYTCTKVERSADGKTVTLYYTFRDEHKFVADFGLPLKITTADLGISGDWTDANVTGVTYGTATASIGEGVTYTPNQTLKGVEQMSLHLSNGSQTSTQIIYIYPATTVYYEEGFASYSDDWSDQGSTGSGLQKAQKLGYSSDEYGTDAKYAAEAAGPSNATQAAATGNGETATFSFVGTGVEVYANTAVDTGLLFIRIKQDGATVRSYLVDTAMRNGLYDMTQGQEVTAYNVPVVAVTDLKYGSYDVVISHPQAARTKDDGTREFRTEPVYLDGFRVFGTIADSNIFADDNEDQPAFRELRDTVLTSLEIKKDDIINAESGEQVFTVSGDLIHDGDYITIISSNNQQDPDANLEAEGDEEEEPAAPTVSAGDLNKDLANAGPKNEIYLRPGESLSFNMKTPREVQLGLKALNSTVKVLINGGVPEEITSSTDMFYRVVEQGQAKGETGKNVTITNTAGGILAVTLVKVCDDPGAAISAPTSIAQSLIDLGLMEAPEVEEPVDESENPFEDVIEGKYYYDPVLWAVKSGITNGKDATHFAPNDSCTRAQAVTFLWRANDQPEPQATTCDFVDVKAGSYYYKAVLWAVENGITNGIDATHFAPDAECTRAQIVTFMYRAAGEPTGFFSTECGFEDVKDGSFYKTAVAWAVACGVTNGKDAAHFAPAENCTRGQIVTFMYRLPTRG